ncbi:uncharacterized protein PV07_01742 [Cladophialophora immunda]|uniref:GA4 desaturase n=1 Tax=Cladophialophora immunda TaxID=569365 RepID=A0A0D2CYQ4_9EURO|nr:uncharacterized protein PV07_01742 [Cladophialophora immunda]KIW35015.1 hypothetical protein PV07_01742 [Cladophialophora immunda]OQV10593.1 hypothetical protein CLAIMM_14570 [Cladophialophora immunda]
MATVTMTKETTNGTTTGVNGHTNGSLISGDVEVSLNYYLDPSLGGITHYTPGSAGVYRRKFDTRKVVIHDMRGRESEFNIHKQSFEVAPFTTACKDFVDSEIKSVMYAEAQELLKKITGCTSVHTFSHLVRRDTAESNEATLAALEAAAGDKQIPDNQAMGKVVPARFAHIDQSPNGARRLLQDNLGADVAEKLAKTRWGIVNIWRPIKTIRRDPLALCDSRTIKDEELAIVKSTLPKKGSGQGYYDGVSKGDGFETLELRYGPDHDWWYVSELTPEEALVFKIFDSKRSVKGRSGHTSFIDPRTSQFATRESMELRSFVFYEDEPQED